MGGQRSAKGKMDGVVCGSIFGGDRWEKLMLDVTTRGGGWAWAIGTVAVGAVMAGGTTSGG